jgi:hypothetical protein
MPYFHINIKNNIMPGKSKKGGGLESKPAYNLKPVPADKQKSLGKLPTDVRNKMGYQMNYKMVNKEGFKMAGNPAYKLDPTTDPNLSLINDPSKLSGLDISKGDNVNYDGENMNVLGIDVNKIFKPETRNKTFADLRAEGITVTDEMKQWSKNNPNAPRDQVKTGNQVLDSFNAVVNLGSISQPGTPEVKGDAFTSYDKRQRARGIKFEENLISRKDKKGKRLGEVIDKLEGKESLNKKQQRRLANLKSRQEKNTKIKNRLEDVNKISKKQDLQAVNPSVGKKGRVIVQEGTPGSSTTSALPNVKEIFESDKIKILKNKLAQGAGNGMKPMQLSPKAMNYFNKKNKK